MEGCGFVFDVNLRQLVWIVVPSDDPRHRRFHLLSVDDQFPSKLVDTLQARHHAVFLYTAVGKAVSYDPGSIFSEVGDVFESRYQWACAYWSISAGACGYRDTMLGNVE